MYVYLESLKLTQIVGTALKEVQATVHVMDATAILCGLEPTVKHVQLVLLSVQMEFSMHLPAHATVLLDILEVNVINALLANRIVEVKELSMLLHALAIVPLIFLLEDYVINAIAQQISVETGSKIF